MYDYYSQFPGPNVYEAMTELTLEYPLLNNFIKECIDAEYSKYGSLGSYTGWNVTFKPNIVKKIQLRKRSKQLLRKLFYCFQVYGTILKMYKDIHYKPGGEYMKSLLPIYKNIFK